MALEIKQTLKQSQQLVMTPQLQLAIKLLQLNRLELDQVIQQELAENPLLEVEESPEDYREAGEEMARQGMEFDEVVSRLAEHFEGRSSLPRGVFSEDEERPSLESRATRPTTLADHLLWQLHLSTFTEEERYLGELIIGNLDDDGYLQATLKEIAELAGVAEGKVEDVLKKIQAEFEPPGVAARDLKECLILQIRALGLKNQAVERMISDHLEELERKDYDRISRALGLPLRDVVAAAKVISHLEPKPGRPFSQGSPQYIVPDVYIIKEGEDYRVELNEDGLPKLKINAFYRQSLGMGGDLAARQYLQERFRGAQWLIKSVYQRQQTIKKVVESIVKFQRDFFDKGIAYLKPLVLRDVAQEVQMHESTISRVTANKYAQTPQGLFELRFFFSSKLELDSSIASKSVKEMIKDIISREDPRKPYSDQELVELLSRRGIKVARRTVTKYRETLGILSSSRRRKLF